MSVAADPDPNTTELAIRLMAEGLTSLGRLARKVPAYRQGKPTSPGCVWRWAARGVRATDGTLVKLEAVNLFGRLLSSERALARFLAKLTGPTDPSVADPVPVPPSPADRRRAAEESGHNLEARG